MHPSPLIALVLLVSSLAVVACGGSSPPPEPVDEDPSCAGYEPSNPCMNPDNFELCRALEAQCPGQVQVMESCPLQFACPDEAGSAP